MRSTCAKITYSVHCALNPWLISIVTLTDLIIGWCVCADLSKLLYKEGINDIRIRSWGCLTYDRDEAEKWGQSSSPTTLHFSGCVFCWQNMSWVSLFLISRSKRWNFVLTIHYSNETKLGTEFRTQDRKKLSIDVFDRLSRWRQCYLYPRWRRPLSHT